MEGLGREEGQATFQAKNLRTGRKQQNFDTEFTKEDPVLTPVNPDITKTIQQEEFDGFSFTNDVFGKLLTQPPKKH